MKSKRPQTATDDETWVANQPNPTLNAFDQGDTRTTTVIVEDPVLMRQREGKPGGGKGPLLSNDKSLTLSGSNDQTLFTPIPDSLCTNYSFDTQFGSNAEVYKDKAPPLKASQQSPSIANSFTMAVRRLTPLECERLMGWPDNWTATKADGTPQSDTHRYKQCGNGVASPVAQWIAQQLLKLNTP